MRFRFFLNRISRNADLTYHYAYPLSAAIYKTMQRADRASASVLSDREYGVRGLRRFKLFTFSDIRTPLIAAGQGWLMSQREAQLVVSFHLPVAAEKLIRDIFLDQELALGDGRLHTVFRVEQVLSIPGGISRKDAAGSRRTLLLQPLSPVVCGIRRRMDSYTFLSPDDAAFIPQLMHSWQEKYRALYGEAVSKAVMEGAGMEVVRFPRGSRSRLITIKAYTPAETKIRGFTHFRLRVWGQAAALHLLINTGAGMYNSMGMGCMEVRE